MSNRSVYVNGFDSGRCRRGSLASSLMRRGSGFVIPTNTLSERAAAPRRYSRWPLWKGWKRPWIMPRPLFNDDAGPLLDATDPADEQPLAGELRLEGCAALGWNRNEETAGRLRVVAERGKRVRQAVQRDVRTGEVAGARVGARSDSVAREVERTVDCG